MKARSALSTAATAVAAAAVLLIIMEALLAAFGAPLAPARWMQDPMVINDKPVFVRDNSSSAQSRITRPEYARLDHAVQRFPARKPEGSLRVFCLGGSTTAGWPAPRKASYPLWLRAMLADALPGRRVEVINAGLHGTDSTRDLSVAREVLRYRPDVMILWTGYNDYQMHFLRKNLRGSAGIAWRVHGFLAPRSRLYAAALALSRKKAASQWTRTAATLDDVEQDALVRNFAANLDSILRESRASGVKVVLLTLPFNPAFPSKGPEYTRTLVRINAAIKQAAAREKTPLLDLSAEKGLTADYVDHVHPSPRGYGRIARRLTSAVCAAAKTSCRMERLRADEDYRAVLKLDDPEFLAHYHVRLGLLYDSHGFDAKAGEHFARAELVSPNEMLVYEEISSLATPPLAARLAAANRELGFASRAARYETLATRLK